MVHLVHDIPRYSRAACCAVPTDQECRTPGQHTLYPTAPGQHALYPTQHAPLLFPIFQGSIRCTCRPGVQYSTPGSICEYPFERIPNSVNVYQVHIVCTIHVSQHVQSCLPLCEHRSFFRHVFVSSFVAAARLSVSSSLPSLSCRSCRAINPLEA